MEETKIVSSQMNDLDSEIGKVETLMLEGSLDEASSQAEALLHKHGKSKRVQSLLNAVKRRQLNRGMAEVRKLNSSGKAAEADILVRALAETHGENEKLGELQALIEVRLRRALPGQIILLVEQGMITEAEALVERFGEERKDDERYKEAIKRLERKKHRIALDAQQRMIAKGKALLEAGQPAKALEEMRRPDDITAEKRVTWVRTYVMALRETGAFQEIVDLLEPHLGESGNLGPLVQDALGEAYERLGRVDDAQKLFRSKLFVPEIKIEGSLRAALMRAEEIKPIKLPNRGITQPLLDRFWALADQTKWKRDEWTNQIRRGLASQAILRGLAFTDSAHAQELREIVQVKSYDNLLALSRAGKPCMAVGTHLGPVMAIVPVLQDYAIPASIMTGLPMPSELQTEYINFIYTKRRSLATLREIDKAVSNGRVLCMAVDVDEGLGDGDKGYSFPIFGHEVRVFSMVTRIIHRYKLPSFLTPLVFKDDGIGATAISLPEPGDGEDADSFAARWWQAYMDQYVQLLKGDPRNLLIVGGMVYRALTKNAESLEGARALPISIGEALD